MATRKQILMGESDMADAQTDEPTRQKPLRLWPGVVAAVLLALIWIGVPIVAPESEAGLIAVLGGFVGTLAIVVWWAFFSRAPRSERWGAVVLMIVALVATPAHPRPIGGDGESGVPVLHLRRPDTGPRVRGLGGGQPSPRRRTAARVDGRDHPAGVRRVGARPKRWRHRRRHAGVRVAVVGDRRGAAPGARCWRRRADDASSGSGSLERNPRRRAPSWPGLRGPDRDGIIRGVRIETDWAASPPVELWRRPIGPGVSSFAVRGNLLYTQEQRGEDEIVAAYDVTTGEPVLETPRREPVLGLACRRRSARDAGRWRRARLHTRRNRNLERARRSQWRRRLGRVTRHPMATRSSRSGVS